eukprot:scaffold319692_cov30-Attheya_sp.AAC.1
MGDPAAALNNDNGNMMLVLCEEASPPYDLHRPASPPLASTLACPIPLIAFAAVDESLKPYIFLYCTLSRPLTGLDQPHRQAENLPKSDEFFETEVDIKTKPAQSFFSLGDNNGVRCRE